MADAIRPARLEELGALSALCLRSKAVWGYDAAFLEACAEELRLTKADLVETRLAVAEGDGAVLGVVQLAFSGRDAFLEKLFVEPGRLRGGIGRRLFHWAVAEARGAGASRLVIEADPDAEPFYRRLGARPIGSVPSGSVPGRLLPMLALDL